MDCQIYEVVSMKKMAAALCPPLLASCWRRIHNPGVTFAGDFQSWDAARGAGTGYDDTAILNKVLEATMKVRRGEAAYERDSVIFANIQMAWPVFSGLLMAANHAERSLRVIDVGGALGSSYFQNQALLRHAGITTIRWHVIEQASFVATGRIHLQDDNLRFAERIRDAGPADVILLSCVLPYVAKPLDMLAEVLAAKPEFIILDRTPIVKTPGKNRLTRQTVPAHICAASYPAWFFQEEGLLAPLGRDYERLARFATLGGRVT